MKKLLCFIGGLLLLMNLTAQTAVTDPPLSVGFPLPLTDLGKILYYKDTVANLKDFAGKTLLFEFWFTQCGTCIESFPKMDSIQERLGDKMQLIMVAHEPDSVVAPFLQAYEKKHHIKWRIPVITGDTILHQYFRHRSEASYALLAPDNRLVIQFSFSFLKKGVMEALLKNIQDASLDPKF